MNWLFRTSLACLYLSSLGSTSTTAALPVYGSPGYTPGVGGYIVSVGAVDGINDSLAVNDAGVAIGRAIRYDGAGVDRDMRSLRWSATTSEVLGNLGTSGGLAFTAAHAIDDAGVAVGAATVGFGENQPVRWNAPSTVAAQIPTPVGFAGAGAWDVNDSGTILGIAVLDGGMGTRAVRWNAAGTPALLPNLPGYFSAEAYDLNDSGTAVGRAFTGDDDRAVRWDSAGTISELGHLGLSAAGTTVVNPRALNSAGTAVGYAYEHDGSGAYLGTVPVRWEAASAPAVALQTLAPGSSGYRFGVAWAINDAGVAVGSVIKAPAFPTDEFGMRAARWDTAGTGVTLLGTLGVAANGEASSEAFAINAAGLIVGTASAPASATDPAIPRAVLWGATGSAVNLNTLIDPASGWVLTHAYAVSDTGWIAGDGYFDPDGPGGQDAYGRHFLMHVPEPATSTLFVISMAGIVALTRRPTRTLAWGEHH